MAPKGKAGTRIPWSAGTFAFLANRVAGVALALYLIAHIAVIATAAKSRIGFDSVMEKLHTPFFLSLEMLLLLAVIFHGFNGIRLLLIDLGMQPRKQGLMFWWAVAVSAVVFALAAIICIPVIVGRL